MLTQEQKGADWVFRRVISAFIFIQWRCQ